MIYPAADKLDAMESKYALVIVAAKRAKQVKDGARRYVPSRSTNTLTVALEEIAEGFIVPLLVGDPEQLPARVPATPVLGGLVSTSDEEGESIHEHTAAEIGALLAGDVDVHAFEADSVLDDDIMQTQDDVMEAEIDDAAEEGPFSIVMPGDESMDAGATDNAQDSENLEIDNAETEEE